MPEMQPLRGVAQNDWAVTGMMGQRERRFLSSIYLDPAQEEEANLRMMRRWQEVEANEVRFKEYYLDDADLVVVGFGSAGRVALSAVRAARAQGIKVGLLRPITVAPFPKQVLAELIGRTRGFLVAEMNGGQMLDDVMAVVKDYAPVEFYGRPGGVVPFPDEILAEIERMANNPLPTQGHPRDRWLARASRLN